MKILSKHKDYYDYLQGYYGIDSKIVLDRTVYDNTSNVIKSETFPIVLYICGKVYQALWFKDCDKYCYGEELGEKLIEKNLLAKNAYFFDNEDKENYWRLKSSDKILKNPIIDKENKNKELNCPILLYGLGKFYKFPILSNFDFQKYVDAHTMWVMLYEWLEKQNEFEIPEVDNKTKIINNGFDLKTSFRKKTNK